MSEQQGQDAQFVLQRIYVKDMSFESPKSPEAVLGKWNPKMNLELNTRNQRINDESFEVVLSVTITAKNDEDEVVYLVEVQQAGIFLIKGLPDDALGRR